MPEWPKGGGGNSSEMKSGRRRWGSSTQPRMDHRDVGPRAEQSANNWPDDIRLEAQFRTEHLSTSATVMTVAPFTSDCSSVFVM